MPSDSSLTSAPEDPSLAPLSLETELAAQDWDDLGRRLTRFAHVRLRRSSWAIAEEIAQEAITRLLDPAYASWDRERHPDLFDCLASIAGGLVSNHVRRKAVRARHVPLREDTDVHEDDAPIDPRAHADDENSAPVADAVLLRDEGQADGEESLAMDRRAEAALAALAARLEDDVPGLALLALIRNGEGRPAAQAKALDVSVPEVYTIKRRVMNHARLVGRDMEQGES